MCPSFWNITFTFEWNPGTTFQSLFKYATKVAHTFCPTYDMIHGENIQKGEEKLVDHFETKIWNISFLLRTNLTKDTKKKRKEKNPPTLKAKQDNNCACLAKRI